MGSTGGFPTVDFTVTDVRPNAPVGIQVPDAVRQATRPCARVTSEAAAAGAWYLTGGSHHSVVTEMKDRVIAAEGIPVITHETNRVFFETSLMAPATMTPDRQQVARRSVVVEGVRDRRVLTDGARTVEIHHVAGNTHADGLLLVYLPAERLLIQADAFTSGPPNAPTPAIVNPLSVNLADNIARLALSVDRLLPLHGRMVSLADLQRAIGRAN